MKRIINGLVILFTIPVIILVISDETGIGAKEDGMKIYSVNSPLKEGQELIDKYKIKGIAKNVESLAFIDLSRGEIFYAYNIDESYKILYSTIKYTKVPDDLVRKYQFSANYNWFQVHGKWIIYGLFALIGLYYLLKHKGVID